MINKVILIGNLGADPEVRHLESGAAVAKLRIATNENYRDKAGEWQTQTEWHDVVMWRYLAERAQELKKGAQIYVEGKLSHRLWDDKDGNKRKTTEVVASYFRQVNRREGGGNSNYFPSEEPPMVSNVPPPANAASNSGGSGSAPDADTPVADDDLPF